MTIRRNVKEVLLIGNDENNFTYGHKMSIRYFKFGRMKIYSRKHKFRQIEDLYTTSTQPCRLTLFILINYILDIVNLIYYQKICLIKIIFLLQVLFPLLPLQTAWGADSTAPNLQSLSFPILIDLGNGNATVSISGGATDDLSGVKNIWVSFDKTFTFTTGTNNGFLANTSITFLSTNPRTTYNVTYVRVTDNEGNYQDYSPTTLSEMGIPTWVIGSA